MSLYNEFSVNENGDIVMDPVDPEEVTNGIDTVPSDQGGNLLDTPEVVPEDDMETEALSPQDYILDSNSVGDPVLYSEGDLTAIVYAITPAGGTLGSSTLDYFDRIVSGLPSDYVYIAYRTDSTNSYNGILVFSEDYDVINNRISFDECTLIEVVRETGAGSNNVTNYYSSTESDIDVNFDIDGSVVYYTNAVPGYPVLGSISQPVSISPFIVGSVLCAVLVSIFTKIIRR